MKSATASVPINSKGEMNMSERMNKEELIALMDTLKIDKEELLISNKHFSIKKRLQLIITL